MTHTGVDGGVPLEELLVGDLVLRLNRVALVTRNDLVVLVAVLGDAGLGRGVTVVGRLRARSRSRGSRDVDAYVVVEPQVGAL